ncbi:ArsB/NhaD family transporter [Escherichia coli]
MDFSDIYPGGILLLAGAIFVLTIVLVIWRPERFRHRLKKCNAGAVLALSLGVVHPG